jgi:hypothetical protein
VDTLTKEKFGNIVMYANVTKEKINEYFRDCLNSLLKEVSLRVFKEILRKKKNPNNIDKKNPALLKKQRHR